MENSTDRAGGVTAGGAFEEVDFAGDTGAQLRVLTERNGSDGENALLQAFEIDLDSDRRTRGASCGGGLGSFGVCLIGGWRGARRGRAADSVIFVALGQQRAGIALAEDGEI